MNYKFLLGVFIAIIALNTVYSQELIDNSRALNRNEIEIEYGLNATAQLPMLSKTYLRVYEGSKIDFNIVDPDRFNILIRNSMIIREIGRGYLNILLSYDSSEYEEVRLGAGGAYKINYSYEFSPFMTITPVIMRPDEDVTKRYSVLYFFVPHPKTSTSDFSAVKPGNIDFGIVSGNDLTGAFAEEVEEKPNKFLAVLIGLIVLAGVLFIIFALKKF